MLKKLFAFIILATALMLSSGALTYAQDQTIDLDAPRESVDFDEPTIWAPEPTSGYADEHGHPLSVEELEAYRKEASKGVYEKYPVPATLVTVAIMGGVAYLLTRRGAKSPFRRFLFWRRVMGPVLVVAAFFITIPIVFLQSADPDAWFIALLLAAAVAAVWRHTNALKQQAAECTAGIWSIHPVIRTLLAVACA